jgi:ABC-type multidrug transport system fused ATPase/permease subunit
MTGPPAAAQAAGLLRPVLRRRRADLLRVLLWSALGALPVLTSGTLVAAALDRGFLAGRPATGLALLAGYAGTTVLGAVAVRQAILPAGRVVEDVRDHVLDVCVRGSLRRAVLDDRVDARAVSQITTQAEQVRLVLSGLLLTIGSVGFSLCAAVVGLASLTPAVVLLTLPALGLAGVTLHRVSRAWRVRYDAALAADEDLSDEVGRTVDALRDVVACGARGRAAADLADRSRAAAKAQVATGDLGGVRVGVLGLAARVPLVVLLVLAPWLLADGWLSTGQLVGAAWYLMSGLDPAVRTLVETLGNTGLELVTVLGRLARSSRLLSYRPSTDGVGGGEPPVRYDLALTEVTFRYGPSSTPVLDRTCLRVRPGEHLAVVGPSGIGKSTLAAVLAGLTTPQSGEVRLGGAPMGQIDSAVLRRDVLLVPQESYVFAGSLRDNLAYLAPGADDAALTEAARAVGADGLVRRRGGYGSVLDADVLSQGERQLICLVRAFVGPARTVILDEATCHLDPVAEARAEEAFASRVGTLVVVAHRISSAQRADRIIVVDGYGIRAGTHAELLSTCQTYADLVGHWGANG